MHKTTITLFLNFLNLLNFILSLVCAINRKRHLGFLLFEGNTGDLKCKEREMLVILELYKHYRELQFYQNMLPHKARDELGNPTRFGDGLTNENVNDVKLNTPPETAIKSRKHSENIQLDKTIKELESIIKEIRNILLLILLSPGQIGANQLK